jgi:hypothetical protein
MSRTSGIAASAVSAAAGVALALSIAGCGGHSSPSSSGPSDEDQIRAVMKEEQDALNRVDYNAYMRTLCAHSRSHPGQDEAAWTASDQASINSYGPIEFTLSNIKVTGNTATADNSTKGQKEPESRRTTDRSTFTREVGSWYNCTP